MFLRRLPHLKKTVFRHGVSLPELNVSSWLNGFASMARCLSVSETASGLQDNEADTPKDANQISRKTSYRHHYYGPLHKRSEDHLTDGRLSFAEVNDHSSPEDLFGDLGQDEDLQLEEQIGKRKLHKVRLHVPLHKRLGNDATAGNISFSELKQSLAPDDLFGDIVQKASLQKPHKHKEVKGSPEEFGILVTEELEEELRDEKLEMASFADDEGEVDESEKPYRRLSDVGRKHTPNHYGRKIEKLSKQGRIYEAIQVLEKEMLVDDRVRPNQYVFTVLIGALGRVGYTRKAFQLFNRMKKFGLQPEDPTYTALFNACSNSPWPEDGLKRATNLRNLMLEKEYPTNLTTYKAMIKAFGRCNNLPMAFALADELETRGLKADAELFSSLLSASLGDTEAGFRHAIQLWRRMRKRKMKPTLYHYNLLVRIIKTCAVGDVSTTSKKEFFPSHEAIPGHLEHGQEELSPDQDQGHGGSAQASEVVKSWWQYDDPLPIPVAQSHPDRAISLLNMDVPNILNPRAKMEGIIAIAPLTTAQARLGLLGGLPGFLRHMNEDQVHPDIKTFTQLLDVLPDNTNSEMDLLSCMQVYDLKPDVHMLNLLIRKRNLRNDHHAAKDILSLMAQLDIPPNIMTYGCLALGCAQKEDGMQLLRDLAKANTRPNKEICNTLLFQSRMNFSYKLEICKSMQYHDIKPDVKFIAALEKSISIAKSRIVALEKGHSVPPSYKCPAWHHGFKTFMHHYRAWLMAMELDIPPHPWEQFKVDPDEKSEVVVGADTGTAAGVSRS